MSQSLEKTPSRGPQGSSWSGPTTSLPHLLDSAPSSLPLLRPPWPPLLLRHAPALRPRPGRSLCLKCPSRRPVWLTSFKSRS